MCDIQIQGDSMKKSMNIVDGFLFKKDNALMYCLVVYNSNDDSFKFIINEFNNFQKKQLFHEIDIHNLVTEKISLYFIIINDSPVEKYITFDIGNGKDIYKAIETMNEEVIENIIFTKNTIYEIFFLENNIKFQ